MARPRKRQAPDATPAGVPPAPPATLPRPLEPVGDGAADPAAAASTDRERAADLLVQLAAARLRDTVDLEAPEQGPLVEWLAAEARAALSPAERAELACEAEAFAARMTAGLAAGAARAEQGRGRGVAERDTTS